MSETSPPQGAQTLARLNVPLGERSYDILIGPALIADAGAHILPFAGSKRAFVVTDSNVASLHGATLAQSLLASGIEARQLVLEPGEKTKSFADIEKLVLLLLEQRLERRDIVIALGGGVIGDLAGFAAAIALRGIGFVQIPTSLLAQVDSSVGGKTGIDTEFGKNTVGAFHQPRLVLIDTSLLSTLPERELKAGYAEIVKYGAIKDAEFFGWLERNGPLVLSGSDEARKYAIYRSCAIKAEAVVADEREAGERALLNFGHTFGHAIEIESGYCERIVHGEAVAIGMAMAASLCVRLGLCPQEDAERLIRHLKTCGLPIHPKDCGLLDLDPARLISHMRHDKKVAGGRITLILLRGIGRAFISGDIDDDALHAYLKDVLR